MATTEVDICNIALGRVRASTISDLEEESPSAVACRQLYANRRDALLAGYAWRFARATRVLALKDEQPEQWLYSYDYPNDCLRVHYILPPDARHAIVTGSGISTPRIDWDPIPYEVATGDDGSRRIWTDYTEAQISYTKRVTAVSLFDPLFEETLEWFLAIDLAIPLGGDSGKTYRSEARAAFKESLDAAWAHAGNEAQHGANRLPRSIRARAGMAADYFRGDLAYRR
jgi:hypothetical protein